MTKSCAKSYLSAYAYTSPMGWGRIGAAAFLAGVGLFAVAPSVQMPLEGPGLSITNRDIISYYRGAGWLQRKVAGSQVPKELFYATLSYHNERRRGYEDIGDLASGLLGLDPSVGLLQIRIGTAEELTHQGHYATLLSLLDPEKNADICLSYYGEQMRTLWYSRDSIVSHPAQMGELLARYLGGPHYNLLRVKGPVSMMLEDCAEEGYFPFPTTIDRARYLAFAGALRTAVLRTERVKDIPEDAKL